MSTLPLTSEDGIPIANDSDSITVGKLGPVLLSDAYLIDKLAHFDRERTPERVVHAKGSGAHGYFEVTHDITKYCKAKLFSHVGKKTPIFTRFSIVRGERGHADTVRDVRGFATKFYTEEGNWDLVANNTPVFFVRDPLKFPDFIHALKRNPKSGLRDPNALFDFLSLVPESLHQVTILYSDRGIPYGYRHMDGFGSHTFKNIGTDGKQYWVKYHLKSDQGIKNFTQEEADLMAGKNADWAQQDLFDAIEAKNFPSWTMYIQVMEFEDAFKYRINSFDVTKVWPHGDYPLIPVGKLVLNRNPDNYFAEVEQVGFKVSAMVPGIEPSPDKMLQGRLFSYGDTVRYRLGVNHNQIPINCPYRSHVRNYQIDGFMNVTNNGDGLPHYWPNSVSGTPEPVSSTPDVHPYEVQGIVDRLTYIHPNSDFEQPGNLYRLQTEDQKEQLITNIVNDLRYAKKDVQERMIRIFSKADPDYGARVSKRLKKIGAA